MKNFIINSTILLILFLCSVCICAKGISFDIDGQLYTEKLFSSAGSKEKIRFGMELVRYYASEQKYEKVIDICENLLQLKLSKKQKYFFLCNMAQAYSCLKKFELAVEKGKEAEELYKNKTEVKMILGKIYKNNSLYELANEKFCEILDIDNYNINALVELGNINRMKENYKQALIYYKAAAKLNNNMSEDFYLDMSKCAAEFGRLGEAESILKTVCNKTKSKKISLALSYVYRKQNMYDEAAKVLIPFTENKSFYDTEVYVKLAFIYVLAKKYEKAKNLLVEFNSHSSDTDLTNLILSEAYFALSDRQKALEVLNETVLNAKSDKIKKYADMLKTVFKKYKI